MRTFGSLLFLSLFGLAAACSPSSGGSGTGAGGACEPVGSYTMSKPTTESSGGACDAVKKSLDAKAKEQTIAVSKSDTGYSAKDANDPNDKPDELTLDASSCELTSAARSQTVDAKDASGKAIKITLATDGMKVKANGDSVTATMTTTLTSAPAADGYPCTITQTQTGARK